MVEKRFLKNETSVVDRETGEIITSSKTYAVRLNQEKFYMTYISHLSGFFQLTSAVDIKVLTKMNMVAEYGTGKVVISPMVRGEMIKFLNISTQQMTNSLKVLKDKGLIKGEKGVFYINPMVYWTGKNSTREELLKDEGIKIILEYKTETVLDEETNTKLTFYTEG